jgi:hypothetical protein
VSLVRGITVMAVGDLYAQYGKLVGAFSIADHPLAPLTKIIPATAHNYCVVTPEQERVATVLMKRIAGRRKLRVSHHHKDDLRQPHFAPVEEVVLIYA